jgi:hypothetical protein
MRHQGEDLKNFLIHDKNDIRHIFESLYQLFIALYLLYLSHYIHYDIKRENIVIQKFTKDVFHLGLIDFDLLSSKAIRAYAWYHIWPVEMYSEKTGDDDDDTKKTPSRTFFDTTPPDDNDDIMDKITKMMDIWNRQAVRLKHLLSDPKTHQKLVDIGLASILYRTHGTRQPMGFPPWFPYFRDETSRRKSSTCFSRSLILVSASLLNRIECRRVKNHGI